MTELFERLNLKILKDYHIVDILIATGDKFINLLNIAQLTANKWIEVLKEKPKLFSYCDLNVFFKSDICYIVKY